MPWISTLDDATKAKMERFNTLAHTGVFGPMTTTANSIYAYHQTYWRLSEKQLALVDSILRRHDNPLPEREKIAVGNLSGINELFNQAKRHLKWPSIVLNIGGDESGNFYLVRLSVAGENARMPGTINVVEHETDVNPYAARPLWYGRILKNGEFEISPQVQADENAKSNVEFAVEQLREFAANPVEVATAHGRLTGRCCFCHLPLTDERSTAVGYGSTCAKNWGLPWGARKYSFTDHNPLGALIADAVAKKIPDPIESLQEPAKRRVPRSKRNIRVRS